MPQNDYPDNSTQERLESLLEIMEEARNQIIDLAEHTQLSPEQEERIEATLSLPASPPYP